MNVDELALECATEILDKLRPALNVDQFLGGECQIKARIQVSVAAALGKKSDQPLKSAWKIAEEWYRESEITHSIQRSKRLLAERSERIPEDVYSPEFATWLTDQYRLAMAKGIQMGRGNEQ